MSIIAYEGWKKLLCYPSRNKVYNTCCLHGQNVLKLCFLSFFLWFRTHRTCTKWAHVLSWHLNLGICIYVCVMLDFVRYIALLWKLLMRLKFTTLLSKINTFLIVEGCNLMKMVIYLEVCESTNGLEYLVRIYKVAIYK